ncbi:MAG: hypothetical protein Q8K67_00755 [Geothrix sp.]|nr:hypothetical protein [Geothrix sp.]
MLDRKGQEAYEKGNTASWIGLGFLNAAYEVFTPGGDRLSQVNARAQNGEDVPTKDLAVAGGLALGQVALTAAPQLLGAGKPLQGAVTEAAAAGGSKSQPINTLGGKLRLETHMEAVPKGVQKALDVKVPGAIMKPRHISIILT